MRWVFPGVVTFLDANSGASIIPKWRIKVPGPIAILFRRLLQLRQFSLFMDPQISYYEPIDPVFNTELFQQIQEISWEHIRKIILQISLFGNSGNFQILDTTIDHLFDIVCFLFWDLGTNNN